MGVMSMRDVGGPGGRGVLWLGLPWVLIAGVLIAEVVNEFLVSAEVRSGSLLSPAPALAAIRGRPQAVAVVSAAALAVGMVVAFYDSPEGVVYRVTLLCAIVVVSLASLLAATVRVRREEHLGRLQRVAETAQLALLPPVPDRAGELRMEARYVAADAEARIGGDLYRAVLFPGSARLIIGDVRGKGLPAVRTASAVLGAFREAAYHEPTLPRVAVRCSEAVARLERDGGLGFAGSPAEADELFVTAVVVEISGAELRVINLGHPPPLLLRERGAAQVSADDTLPPLGMAHQIVGEFPVHVQRWQPGERLLLYTDGIDEARNGNGEFFPLVRVVDTLLTVPLEKLPDLLIEAVDRHTGHRLTDDAALVAVEWSPDGAPSWARDLRNP